ncbi:MAG TPA: RNA polymerase sigma factor [Rhizobiales bacterium]|nr:RNA polymerase sigma factor [Hyphomicrobiales bacterium]
MSLFEERFRRCQNRLMGYAVVLSRDREMARDLVHDCVARALDAPALPGSEQAFRAWLFTTLRNLWIDRVRGDRHRAALAESLVVISAQASVPVSLESALVNAFAVRQAFERLAHDHRDVLALVDISGFSYEETAQVLDIPAGTVMSRVSRARQAQAALLSEETGRPQAKKEENKRR